MAHNKSVKLEMLLSRKTRNHGRYDVVMWFYEHNGEINRTVVYDDIPEGRAETTLHAAKRLLGLLGYTVFE